MTSTESPKCLGIILDGNRRWAKEKGLPKLEGHRKGADRLVECARWVRDRGIGHLAVYAFSTENWNRAEEEVAYLMNLFLEIAEKGLRELSKENIRIRFIGSRDQLPEKLADAMVRLEKEGEKNSFTLWICLSYGGRAEIVAAATKAAASGHPITEESLRSHFWSAEMPDPDIIVRTGGEKRLSNFLTWQSVYSELFFIDPKWPDFSEQDLDSIIEEFSIRERRRGK